MRGPRNLVVLTTVILAACSGSSRSTGRGGGGGNLAHPWKARIAAQVRPYLDHEILSGLVVGVIDGDRQWIYGFGRAGNGDAAPGPRTLFEIGSVTKVYTGLLLADAIERKDVELTTPVATLLPMGVAVPTVGDRVITLELLVSHRSGLPGVPPALLPKASSPDPYAGYKPDALYQDLARTRLEFPPGTRVSYSNYGVGLLGLALARKAGAPTFAVALQHRVLAPLGLRDTSQSVPAGQAGRHAIGHDDDGKVVPFWSFDALAGAGALRSTIADQLAFLRANLDAAAERKVALAAAMRRTHEVMVPGEPNSLAMGWVVDTGGRRWHNGQTGGFHAYIAFDPEKRQAVAVLAATASSLVDQLGVRLLDVLGGDKAIPVTFPGPATLQRYVGTFKVGTGAQAVDFVVTLDGKKLHAKSGTDPAFRLVPQSDKEFFVEALQMLVVFEDPDHVVLGLGGRRVLGVRAAPAPAPTPAPKP